MKITVGRLLSGPALALSSAVLFGASTPFAKILLGEISPWILAGLLYLGAGVGLAGFRAFDRARATREARLRRSDYPVLLGAILSGGVIAPVLLMTGLAVSHASSAALLLNLEGVFTLVIAWVVFRENVDLRVGTGAAAILAGATLLTWRGSVAPTSGGTWAIAGACLAWAIDNNLTRQLSTADPVEVAAIKDLVAGAANVGLALMIGAHFPPVAVTATAALVGLLGYGVSLVLFVLALRYVGTARTGAYFSFAPFVGAALAIPLLGDRPTVQLGVAAALMALGLWLHLTERHTHEHEHEAIVHEHAHAHDEHHQHAHGPDAPSGEPHSHVHAHPRLVHTHPHFPDTHHRHRH